MIVGRPESDKRRGLVDFSGRFFQNRPMPETFVLIPGRTSRQGTSLNEGKDSENYLDEIKLLQVSPADMKRLGLKDGDHVRLRSEQGEIELPCRAAKGEELPPGLLFMAYGDWSSRLMSGDTHGTGMPDSKGIDVTMEKIKP